MALNVDFCEYGGRLKNDAARVFLGAARRQTRLALGHARIGPPRVRRSAVSDAARVCLDAAR